jgi:uncharacterized phage-associated protein
MENKTNDSIEKYYPSSIANFFLYQSFDENIPLTPMKLIKLVYIAYGWHLAIYDKKLFDEKIQAWNYGPVIPSIYHEFKRFGKDQINDYSRSLNEKTGELSLVKVVKDRTEVSKTLKIVWEIYKNHSAEQLSELTHETGSPWDKAINNNGLFSEINDEDIKEISKFAIYKKLINNN